VRTGKQGETGAPAGEEEAPPEAGKQVALAQRRKAQDRAAAAFNRAHPENIAEFKRLTGVGDEVAQIREWQRAHGLKADGKVGPSTLEAARREQHPDDVFEGEGVADDGPALENPVFGDLLMEGAAGEEQREPTPPGEELKGAGESVGHAAEASGLTGGPELESPWLKAAMAPAIVEYLREGDYAEAVKTLAQSFSPAEVLEGLTMACEKLGLHEAVGALQKLAPLGAAATVGLEMVLWTYDGLVSIGEAHERGDRDSRIAIYAGAFAESFLHGDGAGGAAGAVTGEQREAFERGRKDGAATAGRTGELAPVIGKSLLKKYGSEHNAKQAIVDELLQRAGFSGIRLHS
jgi:peptidoglycan hydrolase-like protein with peptidoglycan-binding domain